jgi:hypothetical protein
MLLQLVGVPVFVRAVGQNPVSGAQLRCVALNAVSSSSSSGGGGSSSSSGSSSEPPHDERDLSRGKLLPGDFKGVSLVA